MTHPCKIRIGSPEDLDQILRLDRELITYDSGFDPSLAPDWSLSAEAQDFYLARLSGSEGVAFVAEDSGNLVGFLVGAETDPESYRQPIRLAEAECLFIRATHRGHHLGEALMQAFEDWARARGNERLCLTVSARNAKARRFYERLGFQDYDVVLEKGLLPQF